jgi:hypothetical protein
LVLVDTVVLKEEVRETVVQTAVEVDAVKVMIGTSVEVLKEVRETAVQTAVEVDVANGKSVVVLPHLKNSSKRQ